MAVDRIDLFMRAGGGSLRGWHSSGGVDAGVAFMGRAAARLWSVRPLDVLLISD